MRWRTCCEPPPRHRLSGVIARLVLFLTLLGLGTAHAQSSTSPVRTIAPTQLLVTTLNGGGTLAVYVDPDWVRPRPDITRVVIMVHDESRNAALFTRYARKAREAAAGVGHDTMLVVPQFLAPVDLLSHQLSASFLRWQVGEWIGGGIAHGPALLSSFIALDAILERLSSLRLFPNLRDVVIAGHGAGAQLVQRYAAVGRGQTILDGREIRVRYVVANPSSYLYFRPERPVPVDVAACPGHHIWPYGTDRLPNYVADPARLEATYAARDVVYLLSAADNDPAASDLDTACPAMAQGDNRLARGLAYEAMLRRVHGPDMRHRVLQVPRIGHDAEAVFASPCGLATLFDTAGCEAASK